MKERQLKAHMRAAYVYADLSYCTRRKVGCVIVTDDRIVSIGYNGTLPGEDNCCEHHVDGRWTTKPTVIHAEPNALAKLRKSSEIITDATALFSTTAPCVHCAEEIVNDRIKLVYYHDLYKNKHGLEYLADHSVLIQHIIP